MPFTFTTDPQTGEKRTVFTGEIGTTKRAVVSSKPNLPFGLLQPPIDHIPIPTFIPGRGIIDASTDPNLGPLMGMSPVSIPSHVGAVWNALTAGHGELQRTGDWGKAIQQANKNWVRSLETTPLLGSERVIYNATTGLAQSLSNLAQSGSRRPGQADSPLLGMFPPMPKARAQGTWSIGPIGIEKTVTDLTQGALVFIPAEIAIGVAGTGLAGTAAAGALSRLPGIAQLLRVGKAVEAVPTTLRTAAAATEGVGGVSGGLRVAATTASVAGKVARVGTEGAAAGFFTDFAAFTPEERTQASQLVDLARQSKQGQAALDYVERAAGTPLHGPLQALVLSGSNDTEIEARWKNAVFGLPVGFAIGNVIHTAGLAAKAIFNRSVAAERLHAAINQPEPSVPSAGTSAAAAEPGTPASQATVEVQAAPVTPVTPAGHGKRTFGPEETQLDITGQRPQELPGAKKMPTWQATPPAEAPTFPTAAAPSGQPIPDPWGEFVQATVAARKATDDAATAMAVVSNAVPDEMGKVGIDAAGAWLPTYGEVVDVAVADVFTDSKRLQYKIAGQNKTGSTGSLRGEDYYNPWMGGTLILWRDPANNKIYVVNGHNRIELAKRTGREFIKGVFVDTPDAETARVVGAIANIGEGRGTPWDGAKLIRDLNLSPEELLRRGLKFSSPMARDSLALSRLPANLFQKGVTGELEMTRALALGSEAIDHAIINDVAKQAAKSGWGADKIAQAIQEAKFAEVRQGEGMLPGMGDWFKTTNFNELLDVRTEAYARLKEEITALTSAAKPQRTGYLEAAGNIVNVEGSRAARERAAQGLALFNRLAGSEGPVRDLLKEMADLVGPKQTAKALVDSYLPKLRTALEEGAKGPQLPFMKPAAAATPAPAPAAEATPAPAAPAPAKAELPDTRGQGVFFHGAAKEFQLTPGGHYATSGLNIYGDGFYVTDDYATAFAYQKKNVKAEPIITMYGASDELSSFGKATPQEINGLLGRGRSKPPSPERMQEISAALRAEASKYKGTNQASRALELADTIDAYKFVDPNAGKIVYQITEKQPVKFFDLDAPATQETLDILQNTVREGSEMSDLIDSSISELSGTPTLAKVFDEMRGYSRSMEIPAHEVTDTWNSFIDELKTQGYGGFTHVGGKLAGGGKRLHQVRIYWEPDTQLELKKVDPASVAVAPAPAATPAAAPIAEPGSIAALRDTTGLAPEEAALFNEIADLLESMDKTNAKQIETARNMLNQAAAIEEMLPRGEAPTARDKAVADLTKAFEAPAAVKPEAPTPAAPTVTTIPLAEKPLAEVVNPPAQPEIQIPAAASRPMPTGARQETTVKSISDWLGISRDEAAAMLNRKGAALDVSRIPGTDLDKAMNDAAMGMTTPETEAVRRAYRQFYGPTKAEEWNGLYRIADEVNKHMSSKKPRLIPVAPEVTQAAMDLVVDTVRELVGDDVAITFKNGIEKRIDTGAHGKPGEVIEIGGGYGVNENGIYLDGDPIEEAMLFVRMGLKRETQTDAEFIIEKMMIAAHESMHAIQHRYLSAEQLDVMNTGIAKLKMAFAYTNWGDKGKTIEHVAQAFEPYYAAVKQGQSPAAAMLGFSPEEQALSRSDAARGEGALQILGKAGVAVIRAIEIFDNLTDFVEKIYNVCRIRKWTSIRDVFAQAAALELKKTGVIRGHILEIDGLPGKVNDYMDALKGGKEWARRIRELKNQGSPIAANLEDIIRESEPDLLLRQMPGGLYSKLPGEPPADVPHPPGPTDDNWAKEYARLRAEYAARVASGEMTWEQVHALNPYQKLESPSGRQYTVRSRELAPDLAAMGKIHGDRPTQSGIPVMNVKQIEEANAQWFKRHGVNYEQVMAGLNELVGAFRNYNQGELNKAMAYADKLQVDAQMAAARWLNAQGTWRENPSAYLEQLIVAADAAKRMHGAVMSIQRPWGQMGLEMQMRRDYEMTGQGLIDIAPQAAEGPAAVPPQGRSVVGDALEEAVAKADADPEAVYTNLTDLLDPELTDALKGGELTPNAMVAADQLATLVNLAGDHPELRTKVWEQLEEIRAAGGLAGDAGAGPGMGPGAGPGMGPGAGPGMGPGMGPGAGPGTRTRQPLATTRKGKDGNSPFMMLLVNNLISSGVTASTNLINGLFNGARLMASESLGHLMLAGVGRGEAARAMYAAQAFVGSIHNVATGFRLAGEAFRLGEPLTNQRSIGGDAIAAMADQDIQGELLPTAAAKQMTGLSINTLNMDQEFAKTWAGKALNAAWQVLGTSGSRLAIAIDTLNSTIAGHTYEFYRHMPRGMELAKEKGLQPFSQEAWQYAGQYAQARLDRQLIDVIRDGRTITDAILDSAEAQRFMDAVNFTNDVSVGMDKRTMSHGLQLGIARGLEGTELQKFATDYVQKGIQMPWFGHIASMPGAGMQKLTEVPVLGPIVKMVNPFMRFGGDLIKSAMRSTPAGVFTDTFWRDFTSEDLNTRARAVGEMALGTGAITLAAAAVATGRIRINGAGPTNPMQKENWLRDRQMPYSIQFWDDNANNWTAPYSMSMFEPAATVLGAIGDYTDLANHVGDETRNRLGAALVLDVLKLTAAGVLNKTFFQGITNLYDAALDPKQVFTGPNQRDPIKRFLSRFLASFVPGSSMLRAARRQIDPVARSIDPSQTGNWAMDLWNETLAEIQIQTPGFSAKFPAQRDWTLPGAPERTVPSIIGTENIPEDLPFLQGAWQFQPLAAMKTVPPVTDPVQRELARLYDRGALFMGPRAADFGPGMRLTPTQLSEYQQIFGSIRDPQTNKTWHQTVSDMIESPNYQQISGQMVNETMPMQGIWIKKEIERFKALAKQQYIETTTRGMEIGAGKAKLREAQQRSESYRTLGAPGAIQESPAPFEATSAADFIRRMNP